MENFGFQPRTKEPGWPDESGPPLVPGTYYYVRFLTNRDLEQMGRPARDQHLHHKGSAGTRQPGDDGDFAGHAHRLAGAAARAVMHSITAGP